MAPADSALPTQYLLETFGPLALGWVVAGILITMLILVIRWFIAEQKAWRTIVDNQASAYQQVVKENTETVTRSQTLMEERTRAMMDEIRNMPRTRPRR